MATQSVQINHLLTLNVKSESLFPMEWFSEYEASRAIGVTVRVERQPGTIFRGPWFTVIARDRSFDLLLQAQGDYFQSGFYELTGKVPVNDASKDSHEAHIERDSFGVTSFYFAPAATFQSYFDSTGVNIQDLLPAAFDKFLPVYWLPFRSSSTENDVEVDLDYLKYMNDSVITLSINETFRRWRPGINRTEFIDVQVTRLFHDSGSLQQQSQKLYQGKIPIDFKKHIQLEEIQTATPTSTAQASSARPTPKSAAASKAISTAKSVINAGAISTPKGRTRAATAASRTDTASHNPNPADTSGKMKVEIRELVVQLKRIGEAELARYGIKRFAPRGSKSGIRIKRRRHDNDDQPNTDALQPGPFKCGYCSVMLATGALLATHVKLLHKLICSICSKKFSSAAKAREHYRECKLQQNESLS